MSRLDDLVPHWDHAARHAVAVDAPPERALAAARAVTLAETPLVRLLFRLRGLRTPPAGSLVDAMVATEFELAVDEPGELVLAAVGRPWQLRGGLRRGVDFAVFAEPGYAKMAMSFSADGRELATETRVLLTDERSRRAFGRYWLLIRPFSGLVRRAWLRAAVRRLA